MCEVFCFIFPTMKTFLKSFLHFLRLLLSRHWVHYYTAEVSDSLHGSRRPFPDCGESCRFIPFRRGVSGKEKAIIFCLLTMCWVLIVKISVAFSHFNRLCAYAHVRLASQETDSIPRSTKKPIFYSVALLPLHHHQLVRSCSVSASKWAMP